MLIRKIKDTIAKHSMLSSGEKVLVAVSGGADSVVLLDVLLRLKDDLAIDISVCHLDHGLRGADGTADLAFVRALAEERSLAFHSKSLGAGALSGKGSLEARARGARYEFFEGLIAGMGGTGETRVALGHTMDDQAETVLMRILKGSAMKGLSGIPPVRGPYIRPLIEVSRAEVEAYAGERKLKFVIDSTNLEEKFLRNRLRRSLIPLLEDEYNPSIKDSLTAISRAASLDHAFIETHARFLYDEAIKGGGPDELVFDVTKLREAPQALSSRVFLMAAEELKGSSVGLYSAHVEAFLSLVAGERPNASLDMPGIFVRREYERVAIALGVSPWKEGEDLLDFEEELLLSGETSLPGIGGAIKASLTEGRLEAKAGESTAVFDLDALTLPLIVRTPRPGDRVRPLGMEGTKKLKDIFIDSKVPPAERKRTPVVLSGADIIWAAGLKRSDLAKVTPDTRRMLTLEFLT